MRRISSEQYLRRFTLPNPDRAACVVKLLVELPKSGLDQSPKPLYVVSFLLPSVWIDWVPKMHGHVAKQTIILDRSFYGLEGGLMVKLRLENIAMLDSDRYHRDTCPMGQNRHPGVKLLGPIPIPLGKDHESPTPFEVSDDFTHRPVVQNRLELGLLRHSKAPKGLVQEANDRIWAIHLIEGFHPVVPGTPHYKQRIEIANMGNGQNERGRR